MSLGNVFSLLSSFNLFLLRALGIYKRFLEFGFVWCRSVVLCLLFSYCWPNLEFTVKVFWNSAIPSISYLMETRQAPRDSANDEHVLPDELGELRSESIVADGDTIDTSKRQYWVVKVRNAEGVAKERSMKVREGNSLKEGEWIEVPFDGPQPCGTDIDGLLGGYLGLLAGKHNLLPISFKRWPNVPINYKNFVFYDVIKSKFWWEPLHEDAAKTYVLKDIGKKWRETGLHIDTYYDMTKTREENIRTPPKSILATEWGSYIDYRLDAKTQQMCSKNKDNRAMLIDNHHGGTKKLKRRKVELKRQMGKPVSRGTLYIDTHKKADGTCTSEKARVACDKIAEIESQGNAPVQVSPNDSLGQVFGKEHSGRVRCVGDGLCPSQVFGCTNPRFSASSSFNPAEHSRVAQLESQVQDLINESKEKDEKFKKIEMFLAQLFTNSSMTIPYDLLSSLDHIQTPNNHPSSQSNTSQP